MIATQSFVGGPWQLGDTRLAACEFPRAESDSACLARCDGGTIDSPGPNWVVLHADHQELFQ